MNIEEAIETLTEYKNDELFGIAGRQALDVVLKELDNRIPVKEIENKIQEYKKLCHEEKDDLLRSHYFHRYASLEELLYKE